MSGQPDNKCSLSQTCNAVKCLDKQIINKYYSSLAAKPVKCLENMKICCSSLASKPVKYLDNLILSVFFMPLPFKEWSRGHLGGGGDLCSLDTFLVFSNRVILGEGWGHIHVLWIHF